MSYLLNKTDGTILTELIDGRIDTRSTNLTLVGRNYNGFGEAFNENFIRLLENFSNSSAPSNPLRGQLWWDTSDERLKIYNGDQWKAAGGPFVQETRPDMVAGDLWIDSARKQLFAFDGSSLLLIGPSYTTEQGLSGFQVETVLDSQARAKTLINLYLNSALIAVISNEEFTPLDTDRIEPLVTEVNPTGKIFKGFNVVEKTEGESATGSAFRFIGVAESTDSLYSPETDEFRRANQFLPSDRAGVTTGTLQIKNDNGLRFSSSAGTVYNIQRIQNESFYIENQEKDSDISLRVRSSSLGSGIVDAIRIDATTARVGIFTGGAGPQYTLDVNGDIRIAGNLRVEGDTITVQSTTLQIQDQTIELATSDGVAAGDDTVAYGGGINLRSTQDDKTILWYSDNVELGTSRGWTSNEPFNLSNQEHSYNIAGSPKLTKDKLLNIFEAPNLLEIGKLNFLEVDELSLNDNIIQGTGGITLQSLDGGMIIDLAGDINIANSRLITGLRTPVSNIVARRDSLVESSGNSSANKEYVDIENRLQPIVLTMDLTGFDPSTFNTVLGGYLNDLYPASIAHRGKEAKIHVYYYLNNSINVVLTTDEIDVRNAADTGTVSVLRSAAVSDITFPRPNRALYTFTINDSGAWIRTTVQSYPN